MHLVGDKVPEVACTGFCTEVACIRPIDVVDDEVHGTFRFEWPQSSVAQSRAVSRPVGFTLPVASARSVRQQALQARGEVARWVGKL